MNIDYIFSRSELEIIKLQIELTKLTMKDWGMEDSELYIKFGDIVHKINNYLMFVPLEET